METIWVVAFLGGSFLQLLSIKDNIVKIEQHLDLLTKRAMRQDGFNV